MAETNKEIVRRWYEDGVNKRNLNLLGELFHQDVVFHSPSLGDGRGLEDGRRYVDAGFTGFPDWHLNVHDLVAEGDKVVARWTATGHHQGQFLGIAPTGRRVSFSGMSISWLKDGRIVECSDFADIHGLMTQLGAVSRPGPSAGVCSQDTFEGAKAAWTTYGGFFKDVANEIGLDRALALHAKQGEGFAAGLSAVTKERLEGRELDLSTFGAVCREFGAKGFGMIGETAETPGSIRMKWTQCPIYDGLAAAGMDHETIGRVCQSMSDVECAALSKEHPKLSGRLEYRKTPDQPCVEEFALAK